MGEGPGDGRGDVAVTRRRTRGWRPGPRRRRPVGSSAREDPRHQRRRCERPRAGRADPGPGALDQGGRPATAGRRPHEIIVVAPSSNYSGAGAAVGSVTDTRPSRTSAPSSRAPRRWRPTGSTPRRRSRSSPGALGAVGPKPDLVLSGINHGVNVGRSVLHSGTVGAALTASQLGHQRAGRLAAGGRGARPVGVGGRPRRRPHPAAGRRARAHRAQPERAAPPARRDPRPALGPGERRRADQGRPGRATWEAPNRRGDRGAGRRRGGALRHGGRARTRRARSSSPSGRPSPHSGDLGLADAEAEDATLVAQGYAALTALRGPAGRGGRGAAGPARPRPRPARWPPSSFAG